MREMLKILATYDRELVIQWQELEKGVRMKSVTVECTCSNDKRKYSGISLRREKRIIWKFFERESYIN